MKYTYTEKPRVRVDIGEYTPSGTMLRWADKNSNELYGICIKIGTKSLVSLKEPHAVWSDINLIANQLVHVESGVTVTLAAD